MRDNYVKLIDFVFGKYMYTVMKNNDKVLYFEVVNNKYVEPIYSFNLYDNEGKSLTSVNEHFFMNQLVNRINVACKKGIFISDQEVVDYLNKVKVSCGDPELKKLFKGSYMSEINEYNFENNKRSIINYLDKFKYDTFVDYNNVSIFNGSLEKNDNKNVADVNLDTSNESVETNDVVNNEPIVESIDDSAENIDVVDGNIDMEVIDVLDNAEQEGSNNIDFTNIPVDNSLGDVVNSNDYFSNSEVESISSGFGENNVNNTFEVSNVDNVVIKNDDSAQQAAPQNNDASLQQVESQNNVDLTAPLDFNTLYSNSVQPTVQETVANQESIQMMPNPNFSGEVFSTEVNQNVDEVVVPEVNQSVNNVQFSNDGFSLAEPLVENSTEFNSSNNNVMYSEQISNSSYLNQVKDRIQNNNFNNELGVLDTNVSESDLEKTVVTDKVELPELEKVSNDDSIKPKKEKRSFGVVIFIIILLILLGVFAYFLYNYVF